MKRPHHCTISTDLHSLRRGQDTDAGDFVQVLANATKRHLVVGHMGPEQFNLSGKLGVSLQDSRILLPGNGQLVVEQGVYPYL